MPAIGLFFYFALPNDAENDTIRLSLTGFKNRNHITYLSVKENSSPWQTAAGWPGICRQWLAAFNKIFIR